MSTTTWCSHRDEFRLNNVAFDEIDLDRNGFISVAEWDAALDTFDIDHDFLLEDVEFEPFL
jgi:hypothetical protein